MSLSLTVINNEKLRKQRIDIILQEFIQSKQMLPVTAELVKKIYFTFCTSPVTVSKLFTFNWHTDRLDSSISDIMILGNFDFPGYHFSNFFMKILLLFHGNADVERGFSINKECIVRNLMEESLIAQRSANSTP